MAQLFVFVVRFVFLALLILILFALTCLKSSPSFTYLNVVACRFDSADDGTADGGLLQSCPT